MAAKSTNYTTLRVRTIVHRSFNKKYKQKIAEINWTPDLIIASYHGIPKKYFNKGDPYHCYCHKTTRLMREKVYIQFQLKQLFNQDLVHKNGYNHTLIKH